MHNQVLPASQYTSIHLLYTKREQSLLDNLPTYANEQGGIDSSHLSQTKKSHYQIQPRGTIMSLDKYELLE